MEMAVKKTLLKGYYFPCTIVVPFPAVSNVLLASTNTFRQVRVV